MLSPVVLQWQLCSSVLCVLLLLPNSVVGITRHYMFNITYQNITRLCNTRSVVTVNGKFPGPRVAREGDQVLVKVVNHIQYHHPLAWDKAAYKRMGRWTCIITQCPIQTGQAYTYNFTITGQRGTLLWHAHISWLRASIYGPIIILPKRNESYPFQKPYKGVPILFGEWFNVDPEAIIAQALQTGAGPNVSDAYTINGLHVPLYNCSSKVGEQLIIVNNCNESIWPGMLGGAGHPTPKDGGFHLGSGEEVVLDLPQKWSGRIWGRQGCYFDNNGKGSCDTGDCSGLLHCQGNGGVPPSTMVEMTLGSSTSPLHFYDVSLVDGFNLPVSMAPVGGGIGCGVASCEVDLNICCPSALEVKRDGKIVGCKSACLAMQSAKYCCTGDYSNPKTCKPTLFAHSSRLYVQRLIVMLLMTLAALTNAGLLAMLLLSALLNEKLQLQQSGSVNLLQYFVDQVWTYVKLSFAFLLFY
ncbi:hypothetical protein GH714_014341 [Hevea brasiliensis]|uniref:Plastocyanin-like domain-containing protein n=1 Tax=Hevea brasiliensis TaxID=3981 RepID=A0A6A6LP26_HEVBR|nr:hypothetical protein GH714_014341 [Hevea brasiliensis]